MGFISIDDIGALLVILVDNFPSFSIYYKLNRTNLKNSFRRKRKLTNTVKG